MTSKQIIVGQSFFRRYGSVYAACAALALPAFCVTVVNGQSHKPAAAAPAKPSAQQPPKDGADVKVTDYGTVDLAVQDTDLAQVLQMLSIQSKKNIITSKAVSATVTANLFDVTFYEALKAILEVNGYTYYEEGNFIYVITQEEAKALEAARRKTESRIYNLQNLSATDANEFITPLLSDKGKSSFRGDVTPGFKPDTANGGADSYAFTARLVVNDYAENLDRIADLIKDIDTPPQQVLVEATVLQTALDEANAFGIDFTILGSLNFTDLTNPLAAVNNLLQGDGRDGVQPADNNAQAISTSVGNTRGPGGLKVGILSDDIAVFLRVLDEVSTTSVLARPKVMALNRQRAQVLVGNRVGYLTTTSTETTTTQSVSFLDTGIQLLFRPFITNEGMIRMELEPKVSEASLRTVTDSNGQTVTIPDELTNQLTTNVRVRDGQTLVLGGLFKESTGITRRQVPYLGDIPVLGLAFRGQDDKVQRNEIIFLITPSIVHDEALWAAGQEGLELVDALRVGARKGLLPFGREAMSTKYNQEAMDAYNRGDIEKALYYTNNSLRQAANQPEMIKFREKLTGEKVKAHDASTAEMIFRQQVARANSPSAMNQSSTTESKISTEMAIEATTESDIDSTTSTEIVNAPTEIPEGFENDGSSMTTDPSMDMAPTTTEVPSMTETPSTIDVPSTIESAPAPTETPFQVEPPLAPQASASPVEGSTASIQKDLAPLTQSQKIFYHRFLHEFFTVAGMPQIAAAYTPAVDPSMPQTEVAGASDVDNPLK